MSAYFEIYCRPAFAFIDITFNFQSTGFELQFKIEWER